MKKIRLVAILALLSSACLYSCAGNKGDNSGQDPQDSEVKNGYYEEVEDEEGNIYTGFFKDGLYDGYGEMEYMTGTIYRGEWANGNWHGTCHILWDSGCIYVGESETIKNRGKMHGIGYMLWTMGDYYVGEWNDGDPNGWGMKAFMVNAAAEKHEEKYNIYMGVMKNNYKIGYGLMRYAEGDIYVGDWTADVRAGQGTVFFGNNRGGLHSFTGTFKNDWIDGEGTMHYANGKVVHGIFDGTTCVRVIETINEGPEEEQQSVEQQARRQAEEIPEYTDNSRLLSWAHMRLGA